MSLKAHRAFAVTPAIEQAIAAYRIALQKEEDAQREVTSARRLLGEAEVRAADARTAVTEARCDLDKALRGFR